jgi:hypothetical protein
LFSAFTSIILLFKWAIINSGLSLVLIPPRTQPASSQYVIQLTMCPC